MVDIVRDKKRARMKILVSSDHSDDETLECRGTILKHEDMGNKNK